MRTSVLTATRAFFTVSNHVAPFIAVRAAEKLFTTPFFSKRRDIEFELLEKAEKLIIPYDKNRELAAYRWGKKSDPIILFVHGWTSTATCFLSFIDPLVAKGFQVISYDSIAHGESPGWTVSMTEWADTVVAALEEFGRVHCIIGHSLGGGAIVIASSLGINTDKIVLLSSVSDIVDVTERFAEALNISASTIEKMRKFAWRKYIKSASKYGEDWQDVFSSSYKVPTLIIHDKDDKEIHWNNSKMMSDQWPWAEFVLTERLGHRRILLDPDVVTRVIDFIAQ